MRPRHPHQGLAEKRQSPAPPPPSSEVIRAAIPAPPPQTKLEALADTWRPPKTTRCFKSKVKSKGGGPFSLFSLHLWFGGREQGSRGVYTGNSWASSCKVGLFLGLKASKTKTTTKKKQTKKKAPSSGGQGCSLHPVSHSPPLCASSRLSPHPSSSVFTEQLFVHYFERLEIHACIFFQHFLSFFAPPHPARFPPLNPELFFASGGWSQT